MTARRAGLLLGALLVLAIAWTLTPLTPLDAIRLRVLVALGGFVVWALVPRQRSFGLAAFAVLAVGAYHGFENPIGKVHAHDVFHYYMGAKYAPELGYTGLYAATLAAETERGGPARASHRIRDLETDALIPGTEAIASHPEQRFSAERWRSFVDDVELFHEQMSPEGWQQLYVDHGYNPPPTWTLIGKTLASIHAPTHGYLAFLASFDLLLSIAIFVAMGWAFGTEVALVAVIFFGCQYPASAAWLEGNFLRLDWLACIVIGIGCLAKRRWAVAGALLGAAAALRLFPALLLFGPVIVAIVRRRWSSRPYKRFFAGAAGAAIGLALLSTIALGPSLTREFVTHIRVHASVPGANHVGVPSLLMFDPSGAQEATIDPTAVDPVAEWRHAREDRYHALRPLHFALFCAAAAAIAWSVRKRASLWLAVVMSVPLVFVAAQLACYYAAVLVACVSAVRVVPRLTRWLLGLAALGSLLGTMPAFSEVVTHEYATQSVVVLAMGAATIAWGWPRCQRR